MKGQFCDSKKANGYALGNDSGKDSHKVSSPLVSVYCGS